MTAWVPATTPKGLPPEATELLKAPDPNVCPRIRTPEHPNIHPNTQHVEALNATQVEFASGSRLIFLAAAVEASTILGAQMAIAEMWALGQATTGAGFRIAKKSAKDHGRSHGHDKAVNKIKAKPYLKDLTHGQLVAACEALDKKLLRQFKYHDCDHILEGAKEGPGGVASAIKRLQKSPEY